MFERFTDYARRVVLNAQDEGRALGQDEVRPEHLLLALTRDRDSAAAAALESQGAWHDAVLETIVAHGGQSGRPSMVPETESLPFGREVKRVLELSLRESLQFGQSHVGTEHVLLALLQQRDSEAAQVLAALDVDPGQVRQALIGALGDSERAPGLAVPPTCPRCGHSISASLAERAVEATDDDGQTARWRVAYCGECGIALGVSPA
jgi:ATP-dependent Clp protease ATP-binding subunit ClpC